MIRKLILWLVGLVVVLVLIVALAGALSPVFGPMIIKKVVNKAGFEADVDSFSVNPFTARVVIKGLEIKNPDTFPEETFLELAEFRGDAKLLSLIGAEKHFQEIYVDIPSVGYVTNKDGVNNVKAFVQALQGEPKEQPAEEQPSEPLKYRIDKFTFKLGKIEVVNEKALLNKQRTINANIVLERENVTSPKDIIVALRADFIRIGAGELFSVLDAPLALVGQSVGALGEGAAQLGDKAAEGAKKAGEAAAEGAKKAGDAVKGLFDKK